MEAVAIRLIHGPEHFGNLLPGELHGGIVFICNMDLNTGGGADVICTVTGSQKHRIREACIGLRQKLRSSGVPKACPEPAGDNILVVLIQQAIFAGKNVLKVHVAHLQTCGQEFCDMPIPGVPLEGGLKPFDALAAEDGIRKRWVQKLHIKHPNLSDLILRIVQPHRISHFVGFFWLLGGIFGVLGIRALGTAFTCQN